MNGRGDVDEGKLLGQHVFITYNSYNLRELLDLKKMGR